MIFEKGERRRTARNKRAFFETSEDFGVFYKVKSTYKCKCFFWNSAATYSPGPCPAKYHLRRKA